MPTAFAILFLRRKFQKTVGPVTLHIVKIVNIGPLSPQKDVDECSKQLVSRGKSAMAEVINGLRSDIELQRCAAAQALMGITNQSFGFDPKADREANRSSIRAVELWYLRNR